MGSLQAVSNFPLEPFGFISDLLRYHEGFLLNNNTKEIRKHLLNLRSAYKKQNPQPPLNNLLQQNHFINNAQNIACYNAFRGEISCNEFMAQSWQLHKNIYLPICDSKTKTMQFREYKSNTKLIKNSYGIGEPSLGSPKIEAYKLDCVLIPVVGFNAQNFRLGFGAGYYDRTFSFKLLEPKKKPYLLGVAYDFQFAEWPIHKFDVPLDDIIIIKTT